jgi:MFS transporter
MTTWFSATAVLPQLRTAWALTTVQASFLTIAVQVGFVAGALVSAFFNLADIVAARTLMLLGALGAAAVNVLLAGAHSAGPAIGLRFLTGAFLAGVYPPGLKAMSTWFRAGRGTALGIMVGALTLGAAAPQFLNGIGGADWHTVIAATSVLTVLGGLTARYLASDGPFPFPKAIFDPRQAASVMRNRAVRLAVLGYFGHQWELYAMWAWIFAFTRAAFTAHGQADPTQDAAFAAFAIIGSGAAGCWAGGILGDRWGRTRLTRCGSGRYRRPSCHCWAWSGTWPRGSGSGSRWCWAVSRSRGTTTPTTTRTRTSTRSTAPMWRRHSRPGGLNARMRGSGWRRPRRWMSPAPTGATSSRSAGVSAGPYGEHRIAPGPPEG